MTEKPWVWVVTRKDKRFLRIRYLDPRTGRTVEKSAGTTRRRDAERMASRLQKELEEGLVREEYGWDTFVDRYEREHVSGLSSKSLASWRTALNWLESILKPKLIEDVTASSLSRFTAKLRGFGKPETTIKSYLRQIRAALGWAKSIGLIRDVPEIPKLRRAKGRSKLARSRAITTEEFERILATVQKVRPADAGQWVRFLNGLWESGFRIGELLSLSWDDTANLHLDDSGAYPFVRILADGEKGQQDRYQPVTPEFWSVVEAGERSGAVFPLLKKDGKPYTEGRVIKVISKIGRAAGVVTSPSDGKCATSHDIGRRAMTTRLGSVLSQEELAAWMRHESAETTRRYYYHAEAQALAAKIWQKQPNRDPSRDPAGNHTFQK